ncbi:hypothetical protein TNCV_3355551 [Trichonephila clavipes]|nr:hypothetical protein TNCV_3355551 [Trichonephila clavipes]
MPIEHLWDELERRLRSQPNRPSSLQALTSAVMDAWKAIPMVTYQKLVESLPKRVHIELPTGANGSGIMMCMMMCVEIGNAQAYWTRLHLKQLSHMCVKGQKAFIKDDSLAQLILVGNMDDSNTELTAICDTAKCVWEKLLSGV